MILFSIFGVAKAIQTAFQEIILNQCSISIPLRMSENQRFFNTSGSMKMEHWFKMGLSR